MHPRPVDVLVERPIGESYTGRDSQLDAAVAELLERGRRSRDPTRLSRGRRSSPDSGSLAARPGRRSPRSASDAAGRPALLRARAALSRASSAYDQVAFMDQYFRWPGNTGFNASLRRVEEILKDAGYVEKSPAPSGATGSTYRIEHRPMRTPAWEPVDATRHDRWRDGAGASRRDESQHAGDQLVLDARHRRRAPTSSTSGKGRRADFGRRPVAGKIVLADGAVGACSPKPCQKHGALGVLAYRMPAYTQPEMHRTSIQFGSIAYDTTRSAWGIPLSRRRGRSSARRAREGERDGARDAPPSKMYPSDELHARRRGARQRGADRSASCSARTCRSRARTTTQRASAT